MVCGTALEYLNNEIRVQCAYCQKNFDALIRCPNGHHVCDDCHNYQSVLLTRKLCSETDSSDPPEIFEMIISSQKIPMLGCHHAFMAAGAFITAVKNEGSLKISESMIDEVYKRTQRQAVGGYCGLTGICGITPALGACFSVILGSRCGTDKEQKTTMLAVSEIVRGIAELTGPSCCKAYARKSIEIAQNFLKANLQIRLPEPKAEIICKDSERHPHGCRKERCLYYHNV